MEPRALKSSIEGFYKCNCCKELIDKSRYLRDKCEYDMTCRCSHWQAYFECDRPVFKEVISG